MELAKTSSLSERNMATTDYTSGVRLRIVEVLAEILLQKFALNFNIRLTPEISRN